MVWLLPLMLTSSDSAGALDKDEQSSQGEQVLEQEKMSWKKSASEIPHTSLPGAGTTG